MNSRMNEDLAWLRVQDMQREAENRRLTAGVPSWRAKSATSRLIVRALASVSSRKVASPAAARPTVETSPHPSSH
jgi:hypothetical protein